MQSALDEIVRRLEGLSSGLSLYTIKVTPFCYLSNFEMLWNLSSGLSLFTIKAWVKHVLVIELPELAEQMEKVLMDLAENTGKQGI